MAQNSPKRLGGFGVFVLPGFFVGVVGSTSVNSSEFSDLSERGSGGVGLGGVGFWFSTFKKPSRNGSEMVPVTVCETVTRTFRCAYVQKSQNSSMARAAKAFASPFVMLSQSLNRAFAMFAFTMRFHARNLGMKTTEFRRIAKPCRNSSEKVCETVSGDHFRSSKMYPSDRRKHPTPLVFGPVSR